MTTTAAWVLLLTIAPAAFGQSAHTHWEPYKAAGRAPSVDQKLTDPVLVGAIDLHAHHGPDSYPRQWDAFEVVALAKERGLRAVVLENHWAETASAAYLVRKHGTPGFEVFGVSSDSGLTGTPNHTDALVLAARVLRESGFDEAALDTLFKANPARLLGLPVL